MSMILSLWARNEIWCEAGAGGAVQRGLAVQGFYSCDFHCPGLLQYITIPSPLLLDSQTGIVKHGHLVEWPSLSPSPAACDLRYTLLPNDWIYFLIQTPVSGPQCHLCPKPLTPLHAARCLHKWVSAQLRLPASQCHQAARGQLQQRSQGRSSSEWRPYSHQRGRRRRRGGDSGIRRVKGGRETPLLWIWTSTCPLTSLSPAQISKHRTICLLLQG